MVLFWVFFFIFKYLGRQLATFVKILVTRLQLFTLIFVAKFIFHLAMGTKGLQLGALVMHDSGVIL